MNNLSKKMVQEVGCVVEVGIPWNLVQKFEQEPRLWEETVDNIYALKKLGDCEILFWKEIRCSDEHIKDFDYYRYQDLSENISVNAVYYIRRFQALCITQEFDIFGIKEMGDGNPGKPNRFWFENEKLIRFLVKITGRNHPVEWSPLKAIDIELSETGSETGNLKLN